MAGLRSAPGAPILLLFFLAPSMQQQDQRTCPPAKDPQQRCRIWDAGKIQRHSLAFTIVDSNINYQLDSTTSSNQASLH